MRGVTIVKLYQPRIYLGTRIPMELVVMRSNQTQDCKKCKGYLKTEFNKEMYTRLYQDVEKYRYIRVVVWDVTNKNRVN